MIAKTWMVCQLCETRHQYLNPKQFTSWASRHRKKKHAGHVGTIKYEAQTDHLSCQATDPCGPRSPATAGKAQQ